MLFKGAGPGTHWHQKDARLTGFSSPKHLAGSANYVLSHITAYSQLSPFTSFTTSYAIARRYACSGPAGQASATNPGYVYTVDLRQLGRAHAVKLLDPVEALAQGLNGNWVHGHNADVDLLLDLVRGRSPSATTRGRLGVSSNLHLPPELAALVNAIRDAEILVEGVLPQPAVTDRDDVY